METVNLFGAQRGRAAQAAAWAMEKERFSTQEMANALAVSTPTAITLLRRLEGHGLVQPCGARGTLSGPTSLCAMSAWWLWISPAR